MVYLPNKPKYKVSTLTKLIARGWQGVQIENSIAGQAAAYEFFSCRRILFLVDQVVWDFVLDGNFDFASTLCYKRTTININHGSNTEQILCGVSNNMVGSVCQSQY